LTANAPSTVALTAHGISKRYGNAVVLDRVDLTLEQGELVALLGPNGAGKTTLMTLLVGHRQPDSGSVVRAGARCGWVPQGSATWQRLTVRENLRAFARLLVVDGDADAVAVDAAERAGLTAWLDHTCTQLSGGLLQRLNVVVGLLGDPAVAVLDEPTTGIDLIHRARLWDLLRTRANDGAAVLYSTHTVEDAAAADRVIVLAAGRVAYSGKLDQIGNGDVTRGLFDMWGATRGDEVQGGTL
jgi:ABC-2 type transport system ATP-binding protein